MTSIKKTLNVEIKGLKDFESLAKNAEQIGDSFDEIRKRQAALNNQLKNVKVGSDQYKAIKSELELLLLLTKLLMHQRLMMRMIH